jgi:hypothetical protein
MILDIWTYLEKNCNPQIYINMDDSSETYWLRLLVREWAQFSIFMYIGYVRIAWFYEYSLHRNTRILLDLWIYQLIFLYNNMLILGIYQSYRIIRKLHPCQCCNCYLSFLFHTGGLSDHKTWHNVSLLCRLWSLKRRLWCLASTVL